MNRAMAELGAALLTKDGAPRPGDVLGCLTALDDPSACSSSPNCQACPLRLAMNETFRTGDPHSGVEATLPILRQGARRETRLLASTALVRIREETKLLLCLEDITERKQLEQQLLHAQKMEAVGQLAGGVAHDFNNILAAIIMHLNLLQQAHGLDDAVIRDLKEVQCYAQRAADLTRQLLIFSRRQAPQVQRLDANVVIENLMRMLRRLIGEDIDMTFQRAAESQWVDADPSMLEQVLMNLCVNARDAMPQGGRLALGTMTLEIPPQEAELTSEARAGRFVCLTVSDTGCGMDPATLKRIFEPFFTTKEVGKGTGLGLATVYGIVQQHHGWVTVESAVGAGTTFRVFVPRTVEPQPTFGERETPVARGRETILLVEDDPGVLHVTAMVLRRCGYGVIEARSGVEALRLRAEAAGQPDLVLTDMVMPGGIGGLDLISRLRHSQPGLKAILTSGYSQELIQQMEQTHPGVRYIVKPCQPAKLAKAVREVLDEN
jgi:signal transduction histidine kinase/ActR/RegA family two-component response regulator